MYISREKCKRAVRNIKKKVDDKEEREKLIKKVIWEYEHQKPYKLKGKRKFRKIRDWR